MDGAMTTRPIVGREAWLEARKALLAQEKALTRAHDAVAAIRRTMPWVRVEKPYRFDTEAGPRDLGELFDGRSQLLVYHFMFGPDWDEGCASCSFLADHIDGARRHLGQRDVTLIAASRAPLGKLQAFRARMGWQFPWVSSGGSDFNYDFGVSFAKADVAAGAVDIQLRPRRLPGRGRARAERLLPRRGRRAVPHLLDLRPRRRPAGRRLQPTSTSRRWGATRTRCPGRWPGSATTTATMRRRAGAGTADLGHALARIAPVPISPTAGPSTR